MNKKSFKFKPQKALTQSGKPWSKIALILVLGFILAGSLIFAGYEFRQIQQIREKTRVQTEQREVTRCEKDIDCSLAIRLDECCSCPEAVSVGVFEKNKNLVKYEEGKDYSRQSKLDCRKVACSPCPPLGKIVCDSRKCKVFLEEEQSDSSMEESCVKTGTGEVMTLLEARQIALKSECAKEIGLKETHFCNNQTGTWWIDLDIQKEGCASACVINVANKKAEINWRCTGLEPGGNKVFCKEPRPEVCTMECIAHPPYICGSDGESYCSACQACSNKKVEWYVIQDEPCEGE